MRYFEVVDSKFNQQWYRDLIGKRYSSPPSYVQVKVINQPLLLGKLDKLWQKAKNMMPMPPSEGPPLPRAWGIKWEGEDFAQKIVREIMEDLKKKGIV